MQELKEIYEQEVVNEVCIYCNGLGSYEYWGKYEICFHCNGTGIVYVCRSYDKLGNLIEEYEVEQW